MRVLSCKELIFVEEKMFGKYILQNFKIHLVGYILIFLLETALICISLIAGGIAFNAMTDRDSINFA